MDAGLNTIEHAGTADIAGRGQRPQLMRGRGSRLEHRSPRHRRSMTTRTRPRARVVAVKSTVTTHADLGLRTWPVQQAVRMDSLLPRAAPRAASQRVGARERGRRPQAGRTAGAALTA
jgi:hypothetical protein